MAPTLDSREVLKRNKTSVSFNEVAVYFSEEEWRNLEPLQKKLYNNVMREIHKTVISLGHTIAHPDVLCRIQKDPNPYIHSQDEDRKATCFPATSSSVLSPDVLFRIKHDEDSNSNNEESPVNNCASKFSRDIGDEPNFASVKNEELYHTDADEIPANFEYPIKIPSGPESEDDMFKINRKDFVCGQGNSRTREVSQLVFNPKLSLWIKQVDGPSQCEDKKESENPSHESNGLKKTDDHSVVESVQKVASEHFSNKENTNEKRPTQHKGISGNKSEQPTKGEESLLSIVLKRANAGSLYMPSYKYLNDFKSSEYSKGIPRIVGKETFYDSKKSFHIPNSNEMLSSIKVKSVPHQQNLHEMDKPYRCNVCEKNFKTVGILNVHMRTHSGIRPYQCNECGKSFRDNWNLKVHQKIHTGETPYKCSICDKGFIQYATYMKHQRIHTGEKPYACCYCDKSFTNSSNLVRHHRTHTGEKPYICMECGKSFSYNTSLIQHKILHRFDTVDNVSKDSEKK